MRWLSSIVLQIMAHTSCVIASLTAFQPSFMILLLIFNSLYTLTRDVSFLITFTQVIRLHKALQQFSIVQWIYFKFQVLQLAIGNLTYDLGLSTTTKLCNITLLQTHPDSASVNAGFIFSPGALYLYSDPEALCVLPAAPSLPKNLLKVNLRLNMSPQNSHSHSLQILSYVRATHVWIFLNGEGLVDQ